MSLVTPAVLPVSRKDLEEKLELFAQIPSVSRVQIDVVDGKFAMPASWPYTAPIEFQGMVARDEMLPHLHQIEYEIDLMCLDAAEAAEAWLARGAARRTFDGEGIIDLARFLAAAHKNFGFGIVSHGMVSFGVALNIESDLSLIEPHLDKVEYVQFMGIARIGRQGQPFDRRVIEKIRSFHSRHPHVAMQVDGGVSLENVKELMLCGVSTIVVGSAILRAADPAIELAKFEAFRTPYAA